MEGVSEAHEEGVALEAQGVGAAVSEEEAVAVEEDSMKVLQTQ